MATKTILSYGTVSRMVDHLAKLLHSEAVSLPVKIYGIPRGGAMVAALLTKFPSILLAETPGNADAFIDDIVDTGRTARQWQKDHPNTPFFALIDKSNPASPCNGPEAAECLHADWIVFPWESQDRAMDDTIVGTITNRIASAGGRFFANDCISDYLEAGEMEELQNEVQHRVEYLLRGLVIDVDRDHNTKGTAKRIAKMYLHEVFKGRYQKAPKITDFPNAKQLDEMYLTGPITIRSACSHHFVPIVGRCWIGIIPGERVIGLSKFNRLVDWVASRPQIQEELVVQIADFIEDQIAPEGLAVVVEATHLCMTWRGVKEPMEAKMTTNVMRGAFRDRPEARAEFMTLVAKQ